MGVCVQREAGGEMTEHAGDRLDVHSVLKRQCSERMPIGYNREQSEKPCNFNGLTTPKYSFSHDI